MGTRYGGCFYLALANGLAPPLVSTRMQVRERALLFRIKAGLDLSTWGQASTT